MRIHVERKLYIVSDTNQYILREYTGRFVKKKDSDEEEEVYKVHGYYTSIEQALRKVMQLKIHESTAETLGDLLQEVKGYKEYLSSLVNV